MKQSAYITPLIMWAAVGLFAPAIGLITSNVTFRGTLEASPRDSMMLSSPVLLSAAPLIRVESGSLLLIGQPGDQATSEANAALLASGKARLMLDNAVITLTGVDTSSEFEPTLTGAPLLDALATLKFESLELKHSTLAIVLPDKTTETLRNVNANLSLKRQGTLVTSGKGDLRGERIGFESTLALQTESRGQRNLPLKLKLRDDNATFDLDGRLILSGTPQLQGQATVAVANVRTMARSFGASWPIGPTLRNLAITGELDWTSTSIAFGKSTFEMDGNAANGALELNLTGPRLAVTGTLAFKSLDLTPYLRSAEKPEPAFSWTSLAASQLKLPFGPLVDADVRISADRVIASSVEFGRSAASVTMRGGKLQADIAELQVHGGRGMGQFSADFTSYWPRLSVRGKLEDVDLGKPLTTMMGHGLIQGPTTIIADLSASGHVAADLIGSLNGKINVKAQSSGRIGADLRGMLNAAQSSNDQGWTIATRAPTTYDQLDLKLLVHDGVVHTDNSQLIAGQSTWTAEGDVDLAGSRIDLKVVTGDAAREGRASTAAKPSGLEISGTIATPSVKPLAPRVTVPTAE